MGSFWKLRLILPNILAALATLVSVGAVTQPASAARLDLGIAATAFPGRFGTQVDSRSATSTSSGVDYSIKVDTLVYQCSSSCTSAAAGVFTYVYRLAVTSATPAGLLLGAERVGSGAFDSNLNYGFLTALSPGIVGTIANPTFNPTNLTWSFTQTNSLGLGDEFAFYAQSTRGEGPVGFQTQYLSGDTTTDSVPGPGAKVPEPSSLLLVGVGTGIVLVGRFWRHSSSNKEGAL